MLEPYRSLIEDILRRADKPPGGKLEIEVRFGSTDPRDEGSTRGEQDTRNSISHVEHSRVLAQIVTGTYGPITQTSDTIEFYPGRIRHTVSDSRSLWEKKIKLSGVEASDQLKLRNYFLRLGVATETPVDPVRDLKVTSIRQRQRISVNLNTSTRLDLTRVTSLGRVSYECEIELVGSEVGLFLSTVDVVWKWIYASDYIYTQREKGALTTRVTNLIGGEKQFKIDRRYLVDVRPLEDHDLVYGGIVGGNTPYCVSHKTDGDRKLLIVDETGIWLVYPPYEYNLILKSSKLSALIGTILDGESVPVSKRREGAPSTKYLYIPSDVLATLGTSVTTSSYLERYSLMDNILKSGGIFSQLRVISVVPKTIKQLSDVPTYFSVLNKFLDEEKQVLFDTDGLIFTPLKPPYNSWAGYHKDDVPKDRSLTRYQDVCKWKPTNMITIDFEIQRSRNVTSLRSRRGKELIDFVDSTLSEPYPFRKNQVVSAPWMEEIGNGSIIEYSWDPTIKLSDSNLLGAFVPIKVRPDKETPNEEWVALSNWRHLRMGTIEAGDLRGTSLRPVFKYHNRIKRDLLSEEGGILLDIGSGRGGDINKWEKYKYVIAVEPDISKIEETGDNTFLRRLQYNRNKNKISIINTGGEDHVTITNEVKRVADLLKVPPKVDTVSLMLSLTLFSPQQLRGLLETIRSVLKPDGAIIFLTADGDAISESFNSSLAERVDVVDQVEEEEKEVSPVGVLDFISARFINNGDGTVDISLPGTIVGQQKEYLVKLSLLMSHLRDLGYRLSYCENADEEKLLSVTQANFSRLYMYGLFVPNKDLKVFTPSVVTSSKEVRKVSLPVSTPTVKAAKTANYVSRAPVSVKPSPASKLEYVPVETVRVGPCINDDTYLPVNVSWYADDKRNGRVVRLATIGDGSSFIHSALKAAYPPYQKDRSCSSRIRFVQNLRRDLAYLLTQKGEDGYRFWFQVSEGEFLKLYLLQICYPSSLKEGDHVMSYEGVQRYLNSNEYIGSDLFQYISFNVGFGIYLFTGTVNDLTLSTIVGKPTKSASCICILSIDDKHFETIGVLKDGKIQTIFNYDDPFLVAARGGRDYSPEEEEEELSSPDLFMKVLFRDLLPENAPLEDRLSLLQQLNDNMETVKSRYPDEPLVQMYFLMKDKIYARLQ